MSDVTRILNAIESGDPHAAAQLLPLVYDKLRPLAAQRLAQEKPGQTLETTAPNSGRRSPFAARSARMVGSSNGTTDLGAQAPGTRREARS